MKAEQLPFIPLGPIGRSTIFKKKETILPYNRMASTVNSIVTHEIRSEHPDGSQNTSIARFFKKRIVDRPYWASTTISAIDHYMLMWQIALEAGLPVTPTVKYSNFEVLSLDISEGGIFFDKNLEFEIAKRTSVERQALFSHPSFRNFMLLPITEIETEAKRIADIASNHNLWLPKDESMNLLVLPDGRWKVVILDPDLLRIYSSQKQQFLCEGNLCKKISEGENKYTPQQLNSKGIISFIQCQERIKKQGIFEDAA